jgi:hypothetical protein
MLHVGYKLSSEEFGPTELIRQAVRAETAGFDFALISDHFHPWSDRQGQSPFVWAVLGGIAAATERLVVVTNVVKHFNWEPRGKWRIHKKPNAWHIRTCRPWFLSELAAVQPRVLVCLGGGRPPKPSSAGMSASRALVAS